MRIENLLLNNINENYSDNIFQEGSVFKGEILEILEDSILIEIKGQGMVRASSTMDIKSLLGDEISFLVKSNEDGKIELKALIKEEGLKTKIGYEKNNSISKILNNINLKETKLSVDLVKNLMKYNAPINEKNVVEGIKLLEKFVELTSLNKDDKVIFFNDVENRLSNSLEEKMILPERTSIKNLLLVDKNTYPEKEDISYLVREFIGNKENIDDQEIKEFNKILSFFIKNEMESSLNNIKNLRQLVKEPIKFSKEFEKLKDLLDVVKSENNLGKLKKPPLNINLKIEDLEESQVKIKNLQEVVDRSQTKTTVASNFKKEINELENKIEFLKEMNQELSFLVLPLHYGKNELDGVLSLLKEEKRQKTLDDKINIYINLNTNHLGNIKIFCQAKLDALSIKINIQEEDLKIFQSSEEGLINKIRSMGFIVDKIEFLVDEDMDIIDTLIANPNPNYFLDIKV